MNILNYACLVFAAFFLIAAAGAASAETGDIRSTVLDTALLPDSTAPAGSSDYGVLNATNWAALDYKFNPNTYGEEFTIRRNKSVGRIDIVYEIRGNVSKYKQPLRDTADPFYVYFGFFGDRYVALANTTSIKSGPAADGHFNTIDPSASGYNLSKAAKLVKDSDDSFFLKTGESLDLGKGYTLVPRQIDVDGNKVLLAFLKDGALVDETIIRPVNGTGIWTLNRTVLNESDIVVFRVNVNEVFQGSVDSIVSVNAVWLVDYENAFEIRDDVDYGKFDCREASWNKIVYEIENLAVKADCTEELGRNIFLKTGSRFNPAAGRGEFVLLKTKDVNGSLTIRSSVTPYGKDSSADAVSFDYKNFGAFYYDMDSGVSTEKLDINWDAGDRSTVPEGQMIYSSTPQKTAYAYSGWTADQYHVLGLLGGSYVPVQKKDASLTTPEKLMTLVLDTDDKYTMKTGQVLDMGSGYQLIPDQIDVKGRKVLLTLQKDGAVVSRAVIATDADTADSRTWFFDTDVLNESDAHVFRVHVNNVFQGSSDSLVEIEGLWLADMDGASALTSGTSYGKMDYDGTEIVSAAGGLSERLVFRSNKEILIEPDKIIILAQMGSVTMTLQTGENDRDRQRHFILNVKKKLPASPAGDADPDDVPGASASPADSGPAANDPPVSEQNDDNRTAKDAGDGKPAGRSLPGVPAAFLPVIFAAACLLLKRRGPGSD